jgi:NTE family protein
MCDVTLLAGVRLFADLPPEQLAALARVGRQVEVRAGQLLFEQGQPGDTLYVVRSGRVEVVVDGDIVRAHGRGEAFGELALLSGGRRTATVRARRDTELLGIGRADFERVLRTEPAFALGMVGHLALRLRRGDVPAASPPRSTVLVLVPAQEALPEPVVRTLGDLLVEQLRGHHRVATLAGDAEASRWAGALDAAESANDLVVLVAPRPHGPWAEFCLRQADRTLALVDPARGGPPVIRPRTCQLVALGGHGLDRWLDALAPTTHHLVDLATPEVDLARLARRVSGHAVGLVLSGGGARGLAHIGVVDVLRQAGVEVDRVGGTSMGAVIAGMVAMGMSVDEMMQAARRELGGARPFTDYTWPRHALIRGHRARAGLARLFGAARIEQQRCAMFAVSVDLLAAEEVVHRRGRIAEVVSLSVGIPGIAPPQRVGRRLHVDGGVLDNLPIGVMTADGEGPVIASDVLAPFTELPGARAPDQLPKIIDTIGRSMTLASSQRTAADRALARTIVTPALGSIGMFDFRRLEEIVDIGRESAADALLDLPNLAPLAGARHG